LQRLDPMLVPTEVLTMENRLRESLGANARRIELMVVRRGLVYASMRWAAR